MRIYVRSSFSLSSLLSFPSSLAAFVAVEGVALAQKVGEKEAEVAQTASILTLVSF